MNRRVILPLLFLLLIVGGVIYLNNRTTTNYALPHSRGNVNFDVYYTRDGERISNFIQNSFFSDGIEIDGIAGTYGYSVEVEGETDGAIYVERDVWCEVYISISDRLLSNVSLYHAKDGELEGRFSFEKNIDELITNPMNDMEYKIRVIGKIVVGVLDTDGTNEVKDSRQIVKESTVVYQAPLPVNKQFIVRIVDFKDVGEAYSVFGGGSISIIYPLTALVIIILVWRLRH